MAETKEKVNLITIFKNVPLAFDANIIGVVNDMPIFKVNKYQLAAAILVKEIYIQSDFLKEHVHSRIARMDPVKITIGLTDLKYSGNLKRRTTIRVEPNPPLPAHIQIHDTSVLTEIVDISTNGISVYIDPLYLSIPEIPPGKLSSRFEVRFKLPGMQLLPIRMKCALRNVNKDKLSGRYRLGLQIFPDKKTKTTIERYIMGEQSRVLQEIKSLYERSLAGKSSK
jgi:hypothetical protein